MNDVRGVSANTLVKSVKTFIKCYIVTCRQLKTQDTPFIVKYDLLTNEITVLGLF